MRHKTVNTKTRLLSAVAAVLALMIAGSQVSSSAADADAAQGVSIPSVSSPASSSPESASTPTTSSPAPASAPAETASTSTNSATAAGASKSARSTGKRKYRDVAPCLSWIDYSKPPRAVILCVHGLGLHNGTYADFAKRMSQYGFAMYAIDMRGFGSFMEAQGRQRVDFVGCLDDIHATLKVLHKVHPGLPVFILGESMGGAIALRATAMYPELIDGLVSSVPSGDRFKQGKTDLRVALHFLEGANKPFDIGTSVVNQATVNPELREDWSKDPLARMNLSAKELMQFQHFMNQNHEMAKLITAKPVLFVQGCRDHLVRPAGTVELFNQLSTPDRKLELIPTAEHLIFEENQFGDIGIDTVRTWLDQHIPATAQTPKGDPLLSGQPETNEK